MAYHFLRESLSEELADASSGRIDRVIGPGLAEDLEDIASIARSIGTHVQRIAPAALQGAAQGFFAGGPAGALAGAVGGGLASSGVLGGRTAVANPSIVNPAALQLLLTLLRPEVVNALISIALGSNGARGVTIAGQAVPIANVANLIQSLAEAASTRHTARASTGVPRYLADARMRGEDITDAGVQTLALLELIHDAWDEDIADNLDDDHEEIAAEDIYPGVFE